MRIFSSIEDLRSFLPVPISADFDALGPSIDLVQTNFIVPIVSEDQFFDLMTKINNADSLSIYEEKLRDCIKTSVAIGAVLEWIPIGNVNIQTGGFTVNKSDTVVPASMARVEDLKSDLWRKFQESLDALIRFMDLNEAEFDDYVASPERAAMYAHFINKTEELGAIVTTRVNRFVFRTMLPVLGRIEEVYIQEILGSDLYDDMKSKIAARTSLGVYAPILPYVQRALGHLAFSDALEEIGVKVDVNGAYIEFQRNNNDPRQTLPPVDAKLLRIVELNKKRGMDAMAALKKHLLDNAADYPLYEASTAYTETPKTIEMDPSTTGNVFGAM